jgi:hypothetical protein
MSVANFILAIFSLGALAASPGYANAFNQRPEQSLSDTHLDALSGDASGNVRDLPGSGKDSETVAKSRMNGRGGIGVWDKSRETSATQAQQGHQSSRERVDPIGDGLGQSAGKRGNHGEAKILSGITPDPDRPAQVNTIGGASRGLMKNERSKIGLLPPRGPFGTLPSTPIKSRGPTQATVSGTTVSNATHLTAINGTEVYHKP